VAAGVIAVCCSPLRAQPLAAQITTDRPDFVEASVTVGPGAFQVETSAAYTRTGSGAMRRAWWSTPTLLRLGLGRTFELRIESPFVVRDASAPGLDGASGFADAALGVKWHTTDPHGALPSSAVLVHAELPTGSSAFRGSGVRPSLRVTLEWALPGGLGLGFMPGIAYLDGDGGRYASGLFGLTLGIPLTPRLRAFTEVAFQRLASASHGDTQGSWDLGGTYLVTDALQLDAAVFFGATDASPDLTFTIGASALIPGG